MNTIVLCVDGLHHGYLGCYGNAWINTPECDRLAAEAWVADAFWLDAPDVERVSTSFWTGRPAWWDGTRGDEGASLPALLDKAGVASTLLSDVPYMAGHRLAGAFDDLISIDEPEAELTATTIERTQMARLFAAASDWLADVSREPFLLWVEARGMAGAWDAPLELRQRFVDDPDEDVPPPDVRFRARRLPADFDPDELLGWRRAYAGQVELFDMCLGGLLESIDQLALREETMLVLVSSRGFPLGEHGRFGHVDCAVYGELVHGPLMIRLPGMCASGGSRSSELVQPADLFATILQWHGLGADHSGSWCRSMLSLARGEECEWRQVAIVKGDEEEWGVHTPAWYLRSGKEDETAQEKLELYCKPDDRWEANDVAGRCREVTVAMEALRTDCVEQGGEPLDSCPELDVRLVEGVD